LRKPDPKIFHYAVKKAGVESAQCIYVGDTISRDIIGSKKADFGLSILIPSFLTKKNDSLLKSKKIKPDIVIHNLKELLNIL
jgi:putative hydrolase of the HAD superfamily